MSKKVRLVKTHGSFWVAQVTFSKEQEKDRLKNRTKYKFLLYYYIITAFFFF